MARKVVRTADRQSKQSSTSGSSSPASEARTRIHLRFHPQPNDDMAQADVITDPQIFWPIAREWDFRMRNRNRWISDLELCSEVAEISRKDLKKLRVELPNIISLARAQVVEVLEDRPPRTPLQDAQLSRTQREKLLSNSEKGNLFIQTFWNILSPFTTSWIENALLRETRRMPWESLLVMATRKYQNHEKLLVYRRLGGLEGRKFDFTAKKTKALFVESAPGRLWGVYDFDLELKAIETYLKGIPVERLQTPTLAELKDYIKHHSPAIIHISGIDGYQGYPILHPKLEATSRDSVALSAGQADGTSELSALPQGVYFRDYSGQAKIEAPEAVATALCAGAQKPLLITCNMYNSSARLAAEAVRLGAGAAIGFQDFIDDTIAEVFFANLFRAWRETPDIPLLQAFSVAVQELDPYISRVRGSGVVLWTSEPLLDVPHSLCLPAHTKQKASKSTRARLELEFDVEPYPALNYSVLHNGKRTMFRVFRIYKFGDSEPDIRVEVNLNVEGRNFVFRQSFIMKHHILDLTDSIAISLTSALSRSLRESVRTTIFVRITKGPEDECYCKTFDVSLLAIDEWKDDAVSGIFLPSFVLPRDPMIPAVIAKAHHYLMALADDSSQGFDGYQSCAGNDDDPAASIDPQTRAIWYALQHDFAMKYINPPPTFTEHSQRLRTPSEILKSASGTCIDLSLLLAACFENIGLYPVVFLLSGHAFAGYWTDVERRKAFRTTKRDPQDPVRNIETKMFLSLLKQKPEELYAENILPSIEWKYGPMRRTEILAAVQNRELVAIEATYLTNGGGFFGACEVGEDNLKLENEFDSMLDIALARDNQVTPLPLAVEENGNNAF